MKLNNSEEIFNKKGKFLFKATEYIKPVIVRGEGSFLWDIDGNRYLDLNSGQFCSAFGHNYQPFNSFISGKLNLIHTNTSIVTPEVLEAAEKMADINSGNLNKTIFLSTGAEANECAIRYAKFITGKNVIVTLNRGYHGLTHATQSMTMNGLWARPTIETYVHVKAPVLEKDAAIEESIISDCINDFEKVIIKNKGHIAAIVLELILGVGGMIILPYNYVKQIREICTKNGILMIIDECQTGFGRTGKWFAYQHYDIIPDIVVSAKSMGLGFPVSAVTFRGDILSTIEGKITHFSSHQNDPLPCSIVTFVIDTIRQKDLLTTNIIKGKYIVDNLSELAKKYTFLMHPRGIGMMTAFDFPIDHIGKNREYTRLFLDTLLEYGVILQAVNQGSTFRILPNYNITFDELDYFLKGLDKALDKIKNYL